MESASNAVLDKVTDGYYAESDNASKKELTPQLLQLEKKQSQLHEQCNELLQSTRKTESEAVQQ